MLILYIHRTVRGSLEPCDWQRWKAGSGGTSAEAFSVRNVTSGLIVGVTKGRTQDSKEESRKSSISSGNIFWGYNKEVH